MRDHPRVALLFNVGLLLGMTTLSAASAAGPKAAPRSEAADKADFEKVCGACHDTSIVSDIRSEAEWKETVEQMVSIGAKGTREQMEAVMRVLLRTLTK